MSTSQSLEDCSVLRAWQIDTRFEELQLRMSDQEVRGREKMLRYDIKSTENSRFIQGSLCLP